MKFKNNYEGDFDTSNLTLDDLEDILEAFETSEACEATNTYPYSF